VAFLSVNLPGLESDSSQHRDGSRAVLARVQPSGTKPLYEVKPPSPFAKATVALKRATPQIPLRADEPVIQNGELDPRKETASGRRGTGGIETSVCSGRLPFAASAQFVCTRSSGRIGWAMLQLVGIEPVTGQGANPNVMGSGVCRSETTRDRVPEERLIHRGRRVAPVRRAAPPAGRGGRCHEINTSRSVHVFSLRQGFWSWSLTTPGSASRRTGPVCATGGTPSGRASPPGSTAPSSCRACAPDAASTPWPPARLAA
jgi:hypothetical protein